MNFAALLIVFASGAFGRSQAEPGCAGNPTTTAVQLPVKEGTNVLVSLVDIGRAGGVCMGIELVDDSLADRTVAHHINQGIPVQSAVRSLLADSPEYCVETRGRILAVQPCHRRGSTWLDFALPRFNVQAEQIQMMSLTFYMWLSAAVRPAQGHAGHVILGDQADTIGPYNKANVTVRDWLDLFVGDSRGAMWITTGPYWRATADDVPGRFWSIIEYHDQRQVRSVLPQVRGGLPSKPR